MRITDLEPSFIGNYAVDANGRASYRMLDSVEGAQGILFVCPKCQRHSVLCWFVNPRNAARVPDEAFPKPGRWTFSGETMDAITLLPSIDLSRVDEKNPPHESRCYWHGWVTAGDAQ